MARWLLSIPFFYILSLRLTFCKQTYRWPAGWLLSISQHICNIASARRWGAKKSEGSVDFVIVVPDNFANVSFYFNNCVLVYVRLDSDHCLSLSLSHYLSNSCCRDLIDVTLYIADFGPLNRAFWAWICNLQYDFHPGQMDQLSILLWRYALNPWTLTHKLFLVITIHNTDGRPGTPVTLSGHLNIKAFAF